MTVRTTAAQLLQGVVDRMLQREDAHAEFTKLVNRIVRKGSPIARRQGLLATNLPRIHACAVERTLSPSDLRERALRLARHVAVAAEGHEERGHLIALVVQLEEDPQPAASQPAARDVQVGGDHYKTMTVQPWDVIDTWPREQRIGFYRGNALKYVMRMGSKDEEAGEAGKARHYLDKLIEVLKEPT